MLNRNVYNNLMPMSYYSSYTGKNKLNEVKEAVKDYIKGKDPKDLNNPKWNQIWHWKQEWKHFKII